MAQINVTPLRLNNVLLRIVDENSTGGDFEKHVSSVELTPNTGSTEWKGLNPNAVFTFPTATTWTATLNYAQDWSSTTSLSSYLFANQGETVTMVFLPDYSSYDAAENRPAFSVQVTIVPGAIGGSVDSVATASVTLQVQGKPTRIVSLA